MRYRPIEAASARAAASSTQDSRLSFQPFVVHCLTCGSQLHVTDPAIVGTIATCPKCHSMVQIDPPSDPLGGESLGSDGLGSDQAGRQVAVGGSSIDSQAITEEAISAIEGASLGAIAAASGFEGGESNAPPRNSTATRHLRIGKVIERVALGKSPWSRHCPSPACSLPSPVSAGLYNPGGNKRPILSRLRLRHKLNAFPERRLIQSHRRLPNPSRPARTVTRSTGYQKAIPRRPARTDHPTVPRPSNHLIRRKHLSLSIRSQGPSPREHWNPHRQASHLVPRTHRHWPT